MNEKNHESTPRAIPPLTHEVLASLDPGIRRTVVWLRFIGYDTRDSGDGHTKVEMIAEGCASPFPSVNAWVPPRMLVSEARRMFDELVKIGVDMSEDAPGLSGTIEASYDPANDIAFITLCGVDDARLEAALKARTPK